MSTKSKGGRVERKTKKVKKKIVIQEHHIRYADEIGGEWKVKIYKGEHHLLTLLQWRKKHSKGYCIAMDEWLRINRDSADDLNGV